MNYKIILKIIFFAFIGGLSYLYISYQTDIDKYVNSLSTAAKDLYITDTIDSGMTIHWRTTVADNSEIEVSRNKEFTDIIKRSIPSYDYSFIKSIKLSDLEAEQTYYFRISNLRKSFDHRDFKTTSIYPVTLEQDYFAITLSTTFADAERSKIPQPLIIDKGALKHTTDYIMTLTNKYEPQRGIISFDSHNDYDVIDISPLVTPGVSNQIEYSLLIDSKEQESKIILINPEDLSLKDRVLFIETLPVDVKSDISLLDIAYASEDTSSDLRFRACCLAPIGETGRFTGLSVTSTEACKVSAGQYPTEQFQTQLTCNQTFNGVCCREEQNAVWVPDFSCAPADILADYTYTQCLEKTPMVEKHMLEVSDLGLSIQLMKFTPTVNADSFQKVMLKEFFSTIKDYTEYVCSTSAESQKWNCATQYRNQSIGSLEYIENGHEVIFFTTQPFEISITGY